MMTAVALVGLNLAGAIATSKYYPRKQIRPVTAANGRGYISYKTDGTIEIGTGNAEIGYRRTRVLWRPLPPSLLRVWSPVIASVTITFLVLIVAVWRTSTQHRNDLPNADETARRTTPVSA
jgi:hypothetical protein